MVVGKEPFVKLEYKTFRFKDNSENKYLVYKDIKNFSVIEASSAGEAIEKSGLTEPYMVVHYDGKAKPFFNKEDLEEIVVNQAEQAENTFKQDIADVAQQAETSKETVSDSKENSQEKPPTEPTRKIQSSS
jgi:hypothetical protein